MAVVPFFNRQVLRKSQPTKRAPDKWDSARFKDIFLASGLYCPQAESSPAHLRVTQNVSRHLYVLALKTKSNAH